MKYSSMMVWLTISKEFVSAISCSTKTVAFSTSFAHFLIVGTPNNAIVYGLGVYPDTGERMLHPMDFIKYGFVLWILCLLVVWVLVFVVTFAVVGFPDGLLETSRAAMESGV